MRTLSFWTGFCVLAGLVLIHPAAAGQIEAVKGKSYQLTKKHGPWMIMVASFRDVQDADRKTSGMTADEAANELVYELRKTGLPAYTFSQKSVQGEVLAQDRGGREELKHYAAQNAMICVLAGNYETAEDSNATRTLKKVKKFKPEFMAMKKSGAIVREMPGNKGPLGGAFLTINPLLDPHEIAQQKPDNELLKLNTGIQNSLLENKGKYTVQVATFTGRMVTPVGNSSMANREEEFDRRLRSSIDELTGKVRTNLNDSGENAAQMAFELRNLRNQNFPNGIEAWVYHDRYESIVTVGSFDNPQDPRIAEIIKALGAKTVRDKSTGQDVLVAEVLTPTQTRNKRAGAQMLMFDPQPRPIEVPHLKAKKAK